MTDVFTTVLNMSFTAAFVITALCLARLLLRKIRAPKWVSYALWAVAGFRLAVPFTIESVLSLIPRSVTEVPMPTRMYVDIPPPSGTQEWMQWAVSSNHSAFRKPVWSAFDTLAVIWLVGIAVMLIYSIISYVRLLRRKDSVATPFIYGFIKPKIHIPDGLDGDELRYAMLHEQTHIKRRDYLVKLLAFALLCVHWFNPLAWVAFLLLCADMEMSCDERVLRELGMEAKADYSQTLLSLSVNRRMLNASPLAFGEGGIKERVKNILKFKKPSRIIIIAALTLTILLSAGFALNSINENEPPIDNEPIKPETTFTLTEQWDPEPQETTPTGDVAASIDSDVRNQVYLGMTNEEVYALFGEPDFRASGLMWYGYNDIGVFNPSSLSSAGMIEIITLKDGTFLSIYELINSAVIQHNNGKFYEPDGVYPTQSHSILALEADKNGFTAYIMSLYLNYVQDGEYDVRDVGGTHTPLALTFDRNANGDYELSEYWEPGDGSYYMPSIRARFPESTWDKVDTQLYIETNTKWCYDQAMYHFVGAIKSAGGRFSISSRHTRVAVVTNIADYDSMDGGIGFSITYFPGATLRIEAYDELNDDFNYGPGSWVIAYADSSKNITIGTDGTDAIPITDDLIGIFDTDIGEYTMRFERYARAE